MDNSKQVDSAFPQNWAAHRLGPLQFTGKFYQAGQCRYLKVETELKFEVSPYLHYLE